MVDVAGGGHVGIGLETTHGIFAAPTLFGPIVSESLQEIRTDSYRVPIIGRAVASGKTPGRHHVAGDITMEALPESMAYFLIASRWGSNVQKTGVGPFVYSATNSNVVHLKANSRSLSLSVDRAGVDFAYLGCQVVQATISFGDGGVPQVTYSIIGRKQTDDYTIGTPPLSDPTELPFSVDECDLTIAGSSRGDIDAESVEFVLNDNGEPRFNLTGQDAADYVKFGEFVGEANYEIDFESKADYAIWRARTAQELILHCEKSANQMLDLEYHGAMYDTFEVALTAIGDQVRASAASRAVHNVSAGFAATLAITTQEDIALV